MIRFLHIALILFSIQNFLLPQNSPMYNAESIVSNYDDDDEDLYRVYVYCDALKMSDNYVYLQGAFYDTSGKKTIINGNVITSDYEPEKYINRFFYFDIPRSTAISQFIIVQTTTNQYVSQSPLYKVKGTSFILTTNNFSTYESNTGWHSPNIDCKTFSNYILKNIDPFVANYTYGYLSYPSLKKYFIKYLLDYDSADLNTITWNDTFLNKKISMKEKMDLLESKSASNFKVNYKRISYFMLSVFLMGISIYMFIYLRRKYKSW